MPFGRLPVGDTLALVEVHGVLGRPGIFVDSAASLSLLPAILEAGASSEVAPDAAEVQTAAERLGAEPLFLRNHAATGR